MTTLSYKRYESLSTLSISSPQRLNLQLTYAENEGESQVELRLENTLDTDIAQWTLHLDLQRDVCAGKGTVMTRCGSHLRLNSDGEQALAPGQSCSLQLIGPPRLLQRLSDLPRGYFLSAGDMVHDVHLQGHNLPAGSQGIAVDEHSSLDTPLQSPLLPAASSVSEVVGHRPWPASATVLADKQAEPALNWLQSMAGLQWQHKESSASADLVCLLDSKLHREAYRLQINRDGIQMEAATAAGFCRAAASLLQLKQSVDGADCLPCLRVEDAPRYHYRALMLDCARHFHDLPTLFDLLDWMALYKLNHFHWHLTDDEAWRLEIQAYPELTEVGAWRGHREVLGPQLGSGPQRYGGYYSRADVARVVEYAAARGITVVPEIDIPGHCRACIESLPELLRDPEDNSRYLSVQFFDDNVLNPGLAGTYQFLETVLAEVCELFPGPYVHLGADEVPNGVWLDSAPCRALMQREGYSEPAELLGHLLCHAQQFLAAQGRTLVGWEEAAQSGKLERSAPICAWTGDAAINQLAEAGYPIISCPAPRAYLDLAWSDDPAEPGLHWAGTADLKACYETAPFPPAIERAMGVQANLWSELIYDREKLEYMMFPRLLATAEWGWHGNAGNDWPEFRARAEHALNFLRSRGVRPRPLDPA